MDLCVLEPCSNVCFRYKNWGVIKLMEKQAVSETAEDPLLNIFEDGVEEFVMYQREKGENYKTKAQRQRQKIQKLEKDLQDEELKKKRNKERRKQHRAKIEKALQGMTEEQIQIFKKQRSEKRRQEREKVKNAMEKGQVFMIDLVYEEKMNGKENKSLGKQIQLISKLIKHIDDPPSVHLCSFGGQAQLQLEKMGFHYWLMTSHQQNVLEVGQQMGKKLVYLSPDAELPLQTVENDTAYILGGLIDRTILKNASLCRSRQLEIEARHLPIREMMKNRKVLNLDHVVLMVLKFRETGDWKMAFQYAAPKRWKKVEQQDEKGGQQDENGGSENDKDGSEGSDAQKQEDRQAEFEKKQPTL